MEKFSSKANWSKELEKEVTKYQYAKKVFLDSADNSDAKEKVIERTQEVLKHEKISDSQKLDDILAQNKIFKYNTKTDFSIRQINYYFEKENIKILDCMIIFLSNEETLDLNS